MKISPVTALRMMDAADLTATVIEYFCWTLILIMAVIGWAVLA